MAFVKQQPEDIEEILETPSYGEKLLVTEKITVVWTRRYFAKLDI